MLELDHVFAIVDDPAGAARRLEGDGWVLDSGQAHVGQGTRNRRLIWSEQFLELLWVTDTAEARSNPLRLDRRVPHAATGASPIGLGFWGVLDPPFANEFWPYDALGPRIWIHRDNERAPERPLVFVLDMSAEQVAARRARMAERSAQHRPGDPREMRIRGPAAPSVPPFAGPPIMHRPGQHLLEVVVDPGGATLQVSDCLEIRA